ncbi:hypothetical protein MPTA5024_24630 [Microbispora sp. ATCC PTA-5024]|nr:hypothetical protein MPTA5024_24630 [Microbispora sp. ATCC PTA-5024]
MDVLVLVGGLMDALVFAVEVIAPVGREVSAGDQSAEFQDGFGTWLVTPSGRR